MSLIQAYLQKPSTQRVLNRKPGEKGFSLIELVVVVAVLAILSAIAVPAFMGMQEEAADAAAKTNLKNAYKECAYQIARGKNNIDPATGSPASYPTFDFPSDDGYYTYDDGNNAANGFCKDANNEFSLTATKGSGNRLTIKLTNGQRTEAGSLSW